MLKEKEDRSGRSRVNLERERTVLPLWNSTPHLAWGGGSGEINHLISVQYSGIKGQKYLGVKETIYTSPLRGWRGIH